MKALILNSGLGHRMGAFVSEHPKCMVEISAKETILGRQLKLIADAGIKEVVMTTGYYDRILVDYCKSLDLPLQYTFINNPLYAETNYIYSIYCARNSLVDDILLIHGDLVFEASVLDDILNFEYSCMKVSSTCSLSEKDFKAVIDNKKVKKVGVEFFDNAVEAQPFYKLKRNDWKIWLDEIISFCESDNCQCYAENAFNQVSDRCNIYAYDVGNRLCSEVDTPEDLAIISEKLKEIENRTVYMCFSTDMIHSGHMAIIRKAEKYGKLIIGVLSDEAIVSYKRFPLLPFEERKSIFENIAGVYEVVEQKTLSYKENLEKYRPTCVVHGDDWKTGIQKLVRNEVTSVLASYGGQLIEFPYSKGDKYDDIEKRARMELSTPDLRRARLKRVLAMKGTISALEAHSGLTGLIVENSIVEENGGAR